MLNRAWAIALVVVSVAFASACGPKVDLKMAVEVVSDPGEATVTFKGKDVGSTPTAVQVTTFDELMSIAARREGAPVSEKRVRIIAPDKAQLVFRFGTDASAVARKLGLAQVLVFDYSEKVSFDSGRSELKPDGLPILNKPRERLKVQGFGKEYPNDSNETTSGRANNRRTELILPQ